ncbi:hypothetical protein V2J09_022850 [Rumex salicifolius]
MSLFHEFLPLSFHTIKHKLNMVAGAMLNSSCSSTSDSDTCRDDALALQLKLIAIGSILVAGVTGVCLPLIGKGQRGGGGFLNHDSNAFVAVKAFAAGVILATGFVHMLPDGSENLTSSCLATDPWSDFPFAGFIAMCAALVTLMADFVGTQVYESKRREKDKGLNLNVGVNIVEAHAHADEHGHGHSHTLVVNSDQNEEEKEEDGHGRHVVVSQVLELGIVSHSVIIGLSIGVSHSPCTIRPLVAALSFHQFFEGFALGGCISQARFKAVKTVLMACFFAITTPSGIAVGIGLASFYNPDSSGALIVEGILDSISAGILIYMSLVDLIAADFMSAKMRCNLRLQIVSYFALFLGAALMSSLAVWS